MLQLYRYRMMFLLNKQKHTSVKCKYLSCYLLVGVSIFLSGCVTVQSQPENDILQSRASAPRQTQTNMDLISLPAPRGVLRAAVYSFRDYTGQYKPQPSNGLSTAVTQGADSILINALLDSRWFAPVERANLQNLLTERKILQSSILENGDGDPELPAVAPAEIMIEGSIVSYDSNTQTGGAGLRVLGVGASTAYREDRVTINLRLIDIDDGLILHNIVSTKRIFSRKLDTGIFSYIDSDEILETEAGYSINEPSHIAITEAIESGLINLIAEAVVSGTLQLADSEDIESDVFERFITTNQRDSFLEQKRLAQAKFIEQKQYAEAVNKRVNDGFATLNGYLLTLEKKREKAVRIARANKQRKLQVAKSSENSTREKSSKKVAYSTKNNVSVVKDENKATPQQGMQPARQVYLTLPAPEKLIADQSRAILRAQAETQIKATKQAHQAALYAHQLILRKEAELREQRIQREKDFSQSGTSSHQDEKINSDGRSDVDIESDAS